MTATHSLAILVVAVLLADQAAAQTTPGSTPKAGSCGEPWDFSLHITGYIVPRDRSYVDPTFTADRRWLHLEGRYNYEDKETGSLWFGRNFSAGEKLKLDVTPMVGGVFGNTTGIAPGIEASLAWKRWGLSTEVEYVFDTKDHTGSFFYSWSELGYSPSKWWRAGLVAQRTKAYHTRFDVQRGLFIGFSHKKVDFTTYVLNIGWARPTVVLDVGFSF